MPRGSLPDRQWEHLDSLLDCYGQIRRRRLNRVLGILLDRQTEVGPDSSLEHRGFDCWKETATGQQKVILRILFPVRMTRRMADRRMMVTAQGAAPPAKTPAEVRQAAAPRQVAPREEVPHEGPPRVAHPHEATPQMMAPQQVAPRGDPFQGVSLEAPQTVTQEIVAPQGVPLKGAPPPQTVAQGLAVPQGVVARERAPPAEVHQERLRQVATPQVVLR